MKIEEGYMPYLGHKTYYRIVGEQSGNKKPLIVMHGGPGSTHNYFEVLDEMAVDGRQIIMYDQLGCGKSAVPSQPELWTAETWVNELIALREHLGLDEVHLLGQSWGGMLEIIYVCDYAPKGIKSMVFSSTLPSAKLWAQEQHRMIKFMSEEDQAAIAKAEETGVYDDPAYLAANDRFMVRHAAPVFTKEDPEPLWREKSQVQKAMLRLGVQTNTRRKEHCRDMITQKNYMMSLSRRLLLAAQTICVHL